MDVRERDARPISFLTAASELHAGTHPRSVERRAGDLGPLLKSGLSNVGLLVRIMGLEGDLTRNPALPRSTTVGRLLCVAPSGWPGPGGVLRNWSQAFHASRCRRHIRSPSAPEDVADFAPL